MKFGKAISIIQHKKNIPINYLIKNCMSRSNYTRFIENKTEISANKFMMIVSRLNISWNELYYIINDYDEPISKFNREYQSAILKQSTKKLTQIRTRLLNQWPNIYNNNNNYNKLFYLICVLNLTIEKIKKEHLLHKYINPIKDYLLNRYNWTYYELSLFNDSIFFFNSKLIWIFLNRVLKDLNKYKYFKSNENECVRLIINASLIYLLQQNIHKVFLLNKKLITIKLQENMILEKLLIKYIQGILMIINNEEKGFTLIKDTLNCFRITNYYSYYPAYKAYYHKILKIYKIQNKLK